MEGKGAALGSSCFPSPLPCSSTLSFQRDLNASLHSSISGYFVSTNACHVPSCVRLAGDTAVGNLCASPSRNIYRGGDNCRCVQRGRCGGLPAPVCPCRISALRAHLGVTTNPALIGSLWGCRPFHSTSSRTESASASEQRWPGGWRV